MRGSGAIVGDVVALLDPSSVLLLATLCVAIVYIFAISSHGGFAIVFGRHLGRLAPV